ncbi:site-2 protease family protein [Halobacteriovorax sp. XZX-3]|uniref:site-2 protease family protein n=1 Tax=unclassified Halobacteriovorax TaxID=2639665 RepID=UPI000CCFF17A|nr:site-2 protease family protein [Halobacteriovorax sp. DA5]POB13818.1 site-2 protease family protein [Halobacteriovorax sp. DA5]
MDLMRIINTLTLALPGFLLAISFHEFGHGWMAKRYGDDTAERIGRLTLNPIPHVDLVGTVIFPMVGIMLGGVPFGWAKPVPVDVRRFKNMKSGIFWVSFAGPGANLILMVLSALFFGMVYAYVPATFSLKTQFMDMLQYSVFINILLAVFNLIPFPPLDGSKMVAAYLDYNSARKYEELQRFSFIFILILWFTPIFGYMIRPVMQLGMVLMNTFAGILS